MSLISPASLAGLAGLSARQLQRMAHAGKVPTAKRTAGGHWEITDSREVRKWARGVAAVKVDQRKSKTRKGWSWSRKMDDAKVALRFMKAQIARPETASFERRAMEDVAESLAVELRSGWGMEIAPPQPTFTEDWRAVREAEKVISNWHKNRWGKPAPNNHIKPEHFREVMRRMEEIAADVLGDGH